MTTFEDEAEALLVEAYIAAIHKPPTVEWVDALALRFGTRGSVATLAEAGRVAGVTRERVRQVASKVEKAMGGRTLHSAKAVAESLVAASPVPDPIGEALCASGMTKPTLAAQGFLNVLRLTGSSPIDLVGTDLVAIDGWLVEEAEASVMKAVSVAHKHTGSYGMTTAEEIRQSLATDANSLDVHDITKVLKRNSSVRWAGDWLWIEKSRDSLHANRLVNTARSILSVNSPQSVESIHAGARRVWKFRRLDILPPVDAMTEFFAASPYFVVEDELVSPVGPLDYREIHGEAAATMIDVLKGSPYQVMDRQSLYEACDAAGIAQGTYGVWTTYAEWMEKFGPNVWGLRGSRPNAGAVEAIRLAAKARTKAEPRRKSWEWTTGGRVAQTMDVTTPLTSTGVLTFVAEIQKLLAGETLSVRISGDPVATVKLGENHSFCWGWHPVLAALGAKQGDVFRITIGIQSRSADVELGGQELWG